MKLISILTLATTLTITGARAQAPVVQATVTLGGDRSTGGHYTLSGSILPLTGAAASGGAYAVIADPFGQTVVVPPISSLVPTVFVQHLGGTVSISWAPLATGFVLETTTSLVNPAWTPVPDGGVAPVTAAVEGGTAFFRLRRAP